MELICPFDTDDPEFVRGFEIGVLWERLQSGEACEVTIHATNAEMVIRLAESTGREFCAEDMGDDWLCVCIS
jgi:type IV secretory pathway ATPase VirB11/archaellum biosynthesis ATPase